jgi:hypothetical protein
MFLGFLSRRTFTGFCRSYLRYCVRSYIRNIWDYQDKVAAEKARLARGGAPRDPLTGRITREDETPNHMVRRIAREVMRSVAAHGGTVDEARGRAHEAANEALCALALARGLPENTYVLGFDNAVIRNDDGSWAAQVRAGRVILEFTRGNEGVGRKSGASPAVKGNGGLRGGAARRWR